MGSVYPYREIKSFKAFVQTVLPTVYDDSLSYYELLNKVVEHLNTMGVTINTMQAWINANAIETYDIIVNSTYGNISNIIDDVKTAVNDNQIVRFIVNPPGLYKYVCYYSGGATETIPETETTRDIMYFCGFKVESSTRNTFRIFKLDTTNGNYTEYDYKLINESDLTSVVSNIFTYIDNTVNSAVPVHGEYNATSGVLSGADYDTFDSAIYAGKVCSIVVKRANQPDVTCYYSSKITYLNESFETFIFSGDTVNPNGSTKGILNVKVQPESVTFSETTIETDITAVNVTFNVTYQNNEYSLYSVNKTPQEVIHAIANNSNIDAKLRVYSAAGDYLFEEYRSINYYGLTTTTETTITLVCQFAGLYNYITETFTFNKNENDANAWEMTHTTSTELYTLHFSISPTSVSDDTPKVSTASATPTEVSNMLSMVNRKPVRCFFDITAGENNTVFYNANGYSCSVYKYKENLSDTQKVVVSFTDYPMYIMGDVVNNTWAVHKKSDGGLPSVNASDNGKFLRVVNGAWAAATVPSAESNSFGGGA